MVMTKEPNDGVLGFLKKPMITNRRTTHEHAHEGLKVPPNAPDGLSCPK
jgi:hypothetical protein